MLIYKDLLSGGWLHAARSIDPQGAGRGAPTLLAGPQATRCCRTPTTSRRSRTASSSRWRARCAAAGQGPGRRQGAARLACWADQLGLTLRVRALQWVELKDADVDIGANPSAEEAEEGVDNASRKVVDLIDAFNLAVRVPPPERSRTRRARAHARAGAGAASLRQEAVHGLHQGGRLQLCACCQVAELTGGLRPGCPQPWLGKVVAKLPAEQQDEFKTKAQPAIKFLLGKLKDLQLCVPGTAAAAALLCPVGCCRLVCHACAADRRVCAASRASQWTLTRRWSTHTMRTGQRSPRSSIRSLRSRRRSADSAAQRTVRQQ